MTPAAPGWELYRSFLFAVQEGSLSGAARALGLTQPTVGRHLDLLEEALGGAPLFLRSQRGLRPTEAALALLPHVKAMEAAAEALIRTASGEAEETRGAVRITASEVVGAEVLPPMLTAFREVYPHISVELMLSNRNEDLLRREADIAMRMVRPAQSALVARSVGSVWLGLHAHHRYGERHGLPRTLAELEGHPLIGFDRETPSISTLKALGLALTREQFALRTDSHLAQLAAIRAGFGIGVCQIGIAKRDPRLIPVLPELIRFEVPVWLVMHEDLRASRRIRLMFDHLVERMLTYLGDEQR